MKIELHLTLVEFEALRDFLTRTLDHQELCDCPYHPELENESLLEKLLAIDERLRKARQLTERGLGGRD